MGTESVPSGSRSTANRSRRVPFNRVNCASLTSLPFTSKLKGMGSPSTVNSPRHTPSAGNFAPPANAADENARIARATEAERLNLMDVFPFESTNRLRQILPLQLSDTASATHDFSDD